MTNRICFGRRYLLLAALLSPIGLLTGCSPAQPFYFGEDGDLSHYVGMATNIEYPDTETCSLQEVDNPPTPLTISNPDFAEPWELKLQDAVRIALENGKVMRQLGGNAFSQQFNIARTNVGALPGSLQSQPQAIPTVYDVAITESDPIFGPEGAISVYDPQYQGSMVWNKNDRPQNAIPGTDFTNNIFQQDLGTFQNSITKRAATGAEFAVRNNVIYDFNNRPFNERGVPSTWTTNIEAAVRQPLLQGAGSQYNRIAGPFDPLRGIGTYLQWDGVVIARLRTDQRLADFEGGVRNFVADVENAYWELYFAYRNLEARKSGRDSALQTWKKIHALWQVQAKGGEADKEAQSREQYFFFRSEVETAQADLFRSENRLRFIMGLAATDGRLIRPTDEPSDAKVLFDWCEVHAEGLVRSVELRQQKWLIKQKELELIASKNLLLPRLDALGTYRWLGMGQDFIEYPGQSYGTNPGAPLLGTDSMSTLASGQFQEWELGLQLNIPLGFRRELAAVRNQQLQLARERSVLQDQELELSHQMADDIRNVDTNYNLTISNFNRRVAAERQVEAVQAAYDAGTVTLDLLLEAQRRRADAEASYYRTLTDYNKAIMYVHFRKGSLLEYNGVYLAEGPWPAKAYFDATRLARARDAGMYLDYGYTRPAVFSQGPFEQFQNTNGTSGHQEGEPTMAAPQGMPEDLQQPTPAAPETDEELPLPSGRTTRGPQGPRFSQAARPQQMPPQQMPMSKVAAARPMEMPMAKTAPSKPMAKKLAAARLDAVEPEQAESKVKLASAEEEAPFDWGDLSLEKAKPAAQSEKTPAPTTSSAGGWKSDAPGTSGTATGWKRAR